MTTAAEIAEWMVSELRREGILSQEIVASDIAQKFGEDFVYANPNGNWAITTAVLKAFNVLTKEGVVWSRSERHWRAREDGDLPGRMQP